jgi:hypothetical protein
VGLQECGTGPYHEAICGLRMPCENHATAAVSRNRQAVPKKTAGSRKSASKMLCKTKYIAKVKLLCMKSNGFAVSACVPRCIIGA